MSREAVVEAVIQGVEAVREGHPSETEVETAVPKAPVAAGAPFNKVKPLCYLEKGE